MDDSAQMDENEFRRIERALEQRLKVLEKLEARRQAPYRNRRYVVDLEIPYKTFVYGTQTPELYTKSFVVSKDASFHVTQLEATCFIQGTLALDSSSATIEVPPVIRSGFIRFEWGVRELGTDREWSDRLLPDSMLMTQTFNPLLFDDTVPLLGGSEVVTSVSVLGMDAAPSGGNVFSTITKITLQFSFVGYEVLQ